MLTWWWQCLCLYFEKYFESLVHFVFVCVQKFTDAWGKQSHWWAVWPGQEIDPSSDPSSFPEAGDPGNYSPDYWPHPAASVGLMMNCKWLAPSAQTPNSNKSSACNNDRSREKTGSYNKAASVTHLRQAFKIHHYLPGPMLRWAGHAGPKERCVVCSGASS